MSWRSTDASERQKSSWQLKCDQEGNWKNKRFYHILANQRFREGSHRKEGFSHALITLVIDSSHRRCYSARNSSMCVALHCVKVMWDFLNARDATATVMMICTPTQPSVSHSIQLDKQAWAFRFLKVRLLKSVLLSAGHLQLRWLLIGGRLLPL